MLLSSLTIATVVGMIVQPPGRAVARPPLPHRGRPSTCGAVVDFLVDRFACSTDRARRAEGQMLAAQVSGFKVELTAATCDELTSRLKLSESELLSRMLLRCPALMGCRPESVASSLSFVQHTLGMSDAETRQVVLRHPQVLGYNFEPSLAALQRNLTLSDLDLRKVVLRFPATLGLSFDTNIAPSIAALKQRLGLTDDELRQVVVSRPTLLGMKRESLAAALDALQHRANLSDAQLRKVVVRFPPLLGLSFDKNIGPKLKQLQDRLQLSSEELGGLVSTLPPLLGYSFEQNVGPTLSYLQGQFDLTDEELRARVLKMPSLLGYSVEKRYRPRVERGREAGLQPARVLDTMALGEARFSALLERQPRESDDHDAA
jgi:hypothetical protein